MGVFLNPGNEGFATALRSRYVDKTGLIGVVNKTLDTSDKLTCISRPRRFGKSYAAQMLCAYYDKSCDSAPLFNHLEISKSETYQTYLNRFDVLYVDMTGVIGEAAPEEMIPFLKRNLLSEIMEQYPSAKNEETFVGALVKAVEEAGNKFIMIIDEWDAPIREFKDNAAFQKEYLDFLRLLFKNSGITNRVFAAAYMTGILPIKKDGTQSAVSDFKEYTMIDPGGYGEYIGFTESEVKALCEDYQAVFTMMKTWYDGYEFQDVGAIYNPNSVMLALERKRFSSYWIETSAASALKTYIQYDYDGLSRTIAELIGGIDAGVDTTGFANDLVTFRGRDDILTLLIHLGYLGYDTETQSVRIPNEEIRLEFSKAVREDGNAETIRRLQESDQLFLDTIEGREDAVAAQIEKVHAEETNPMHYNREDSLRSVIKLAYYTYKNHYLQWEELPAGIGYADVVYLPKKESNYPALVVELKWNQSAESAIEQIKDRNYPAVLDGYDSRLLLVGISYDTSTKVHSCKIEWWEK